MQSPQKRILCVEDHEATCEIIASTLKSFKVISARSKAEALRLAASEEFDLFILDCHLQDGTGLEVCRYIRAIDEKTPIIFATSDVSLNETDVTAIGAQALISKGANFPNALVAIVARLLP